jgi:hypothetical protein
MKMNKQFENTNAIKGVERPLPKYEPPLITTYMDEEFLKMLGPALAYSGCVDLFGQGNCPPAS